MGTFQVMSPTSSDGPPNFSSSGMRSRPRSGPIAPVARPTLGHLHHALRRLGERDVGLAPCRQADLHDVGVHRLGQRAVGVPRPRRAEDARGPRRVGHERRALGHLVADIPHVLDRLVVGLAEVVPDAGVPRHDVRLIAAVGDHVVRALRQPQVLAPIVPAHVHQLHGVERRAAAPGRHRAVRRLALERVLHRHEAAAAAIAPARAEVRADVVVEHHVHVLEDAGAHVSTPSCRAVPRPRRARS